MRVGFVFVRCFDVTDINLTHLLAFNYIRYPNSHIILKSVHCLLITYRNSSTTKITALTA